ncbi:MULTISPECIES: translocation/assembly module TamB domain-containing protein [unclassified Beijerinckia]|uniref:translocation/assembly module TamB domain-containing protein n=1 Tax=unclassified Beijerinckia TaxID=2638183 RepID=UPI00089B4E83|nr:MULTISPECIES: translocation/assembly module TamB domain-containing protein [unclassified Beijerinckia]MDH7795159.1 translocation and assembly module TamB [Beijerinckia sp. GAS462]SEB89998.1 translocation and assembly module TamB [Beijerinckia sp. 28-YEA-48]
MKLSPLRSLAVVTVVTLTAGGLWASYTVLSSAEEDKGVLASFISRMVSSPDMKISIGAIDGPLSSDAIIRNVEISDRNGVWFKLDQARLVWRRLALLRGRLEVDGLEAGKVEVLRKPVSDPTPATAKSEPFDPKSLIPDLPVAVDIRGFRVNEIDLGPDIVGQAARITINGRAKLGDAAAGLDSEINVQRLDAPGTITAKLNYEPQTTVLSVALAANEPAGGMVAGALQIPNRPPVELNLKGDGKLDDFSADLTFTAGPTIGAQAKARLEKAGDGRQFTLDGEGRVAALMPERFVGLMADPVKLGSRGRIGADGVWTFDDLRIATNTASIAYAGTATPDQVKGRLQLALPSLVPLSKLAGRDLTGSADLAMDIDARPKANSYAAKLDGRLGKLTTGVPALDKLIGERLTLSGPFEYSSAGFGASALSVAGQYVTAKLTATGAATKPALAVDAAISDLRQVDERLTGVANLAAQVTGDLNSPDLKGRLSLDKATAVGRPIRRLQLDIDGTDVLGQAKLALKLDGDVDNRAARGSVQVAKAVAGWTIAQSDLTIGRVAIAASGTVAPSGLANGTIKINAPSLEDLSAFALRDMQGRLNADITLIGKDGAQSAEINANGNAIRAGDIAVSRLDISGKGLDLLRKPSIDATARLEGATVSGTTIPRFQVVARGTPSSTNLDLSGEVRGIAVDGKATVAPGERTRIDLTSFNARGNGRRLSLAAPATIYWQNGVASFDQLAIAADSGRLTASGRAGSQLNLAVNARAIPLAIAALVTPGVAASGTLDGEARITGTPSSMAGDWNVKIGKLSDPSLRSSGLPSLDIAANGRLEGTSTSVNAQINAGRAGSLNVTGRVPIDGSARMDLNIRGAIDASAANTMLAANGQTVSGKLNVDLRASGSLADPQVAGNATLAGGTFADPLNGVRLEKINTRLVGSGRELNIEQLSATTPNGGTISGSGKINLAGAGFPGTVHITGRNAQVSSTQTVSSTADFDLNITGTLGTRPNVAGKITILTMDVTVPERLPINLRPLPNTKHIDPGPFVREILALEKKARARAKARSAFDAGLDVAVSAPNRMFVRGRGIDAEFGGDLRLSGSVQKPVIIGQFDMRRGRISIAGKRLDITQGRLTFTGGLTPEIDFVAETTSSDATLQIQVSGPAAQPSFSFGSQPQLPTDEVMSRILFAKPSGSLSAFQAVMLAQSVAQFSGAGPGLDVFEKLRKSLGVDSLDIREDANGVSAGASRYISDNVSIGVRAGARPEQSSVGVNVDITRRVRGVGEVGADGRTSVGIGVEWEY